MAAILNHAVMFVKIWESMRLNFEPQISNQWREDLIVKSGVKKAVVAKFKISLVHTEIEEIRYH